MILVFTLAGRIILDLIFFLFFISSLLIVKPDKILFLFSSSLYNWFDLPDYVRSRFTRYPAFPKLFLKSSSHNHVFRIVYIKRSQFLFFMVHYCHSSHPNTTPFWFELLISFQQFSCCSFLLLSVQSLHSILNFK